ncbi:hypothetical protein [Brucella lupini]|uniref:hypothetical protein n=1 Tax=Brucella lupini TaxID=255457 RepID=UPI00142D6768|nr:hypothetical protein [Brucella lupini]
MHFFAQKLPSERHVAFEAYWKYWEYGPADFVAPSNIESAERLPQWAFCEATPTLRYLVIARFAPNLPQTSAGYRRMKNIRE